MRIFVHFGILVMLIYIADLWLVSWRTSCACLSSNLLDLHCSLSLMEDQRPLPPSPKRLRTNEEVWGLPADAGWARSRYVRTESELSPPLIVDSVDSFAALEMPPLDDVADLLEGSDLYTDEHGRLWELYNGSWWAAVWDGDGGVSWELHQWRDSEGSSWQLFRNEWWTRSFDETAALWVWDVWAP